MHSPSAKLVQKVNGRGLLGPVMGLLCALPLSGHAAGQAASQLQPEMRLSAGWLNGDSGEYVYDAYGISSGIPGYKISELQWQLDNVYMLGLGASITPTERVRINADYWVNAADGDGTMDDYDWLYVGLDWSHWSHHDNTSVSEVSSLDLNGEFAFLEFPPQRTTISALLGYRRDKVGFQSVGGYGIYSDINNGGYRDLLVTFPNVPGITYEQTFTAPYIGLSLRMKSNPDSTPFMLNVSYRFSNQVHGEDVDTHHLRALRFEENGNGGIMHAYDLRLDYLYSKMLSFNLSYASLLYEEIKATTTVTDLTTGVKTFFSGDAAGLDHRTRRLSLGLVYRF